MLSFAILLGAMQFAVAAEAAAAANDASLAQPSTEAAPINWDDNSGPQWIVKAGAIFLDRSRNNSGPIVTDLGGTTQISGGGDFNFKWGAGPEITLSHQCESGNTWEVRYFSIENRVSTLDYGPQAQFNIAGFFNFGVDDLRADAQTDLFNLEFNWLHPLSDQLTFLAGFRTIELHDQLSYLAEFFPGVDATYSWDDMNHLYGGQLGAIWALCCPCNPLQVNCTAKAGVYGNSASSTFTGNTGPITDPQGTMTAFVGELDFTFSYQFNEHLAAYGGYDLLWIDGLALAAHDAALATANSNPGASINTDQGLFYHGATCGLIVSW
jgi:hypothetical protein